MIEWRHIKHEEYIHGKQCQLFHNYNLIYLNSSFCYLFDLSQSNTIANHDIFFLLHILPRLL